MAEAARKPVPVIQQEKIIVTNKHGEKLVGLLHDTGYGNIVILCHGFTATKEDPVMVSLAAALENGGISCFRFDFAGCGESEGIFEYENYWKQADDLHSVVEHFSGTSRVASVILGHSKDVLLRNFTGANVVVLYASKYHDIRTVVNLSGRYDLKTSMAEHFGEAFMEMIKNKGFLDESLIDHPRIDMHEACLQIDKDCQVFTVHGSGDVDVPLDDAVKFSKAIPNHKLHVVPGADHCYTSCYRAELASAVVDYIKTVLQDNLYLPKFQ